MSNYLIVVGKNKKVNQILMNFKTSYGADDSQYSLTHISKSKSFLVFEKRPEHFTSSIIENKKKSHGLYFRGQALDHDSNSMILGLDGFSKFQEENEKYYSPNEEAKFEGSFILARWNGYQFTLQNDLFSIFRILYYSDSEVFIASDSLLMITKCMKFLNIPVEMDMEVARSKAWSDTGTANAPLGEKTIVENVFTICAGKRIILKIDFCNGFINLINSHIGNYISNRYKLKLKVKQTKIKLLFYSDSKPYNESLANCATRMYSSILFTVKAFNPAIEFGLSGGIDSRVLLALCLKSDKIMEHLIIQTSVNPSRRADLDIVNRLSQKYQFDFNNKENNKLILSKSRKSKSIIVENPFGFWVLNSLGSYDAFYLNKIYYQTPSVISMLGVGAEAIKQTMGQMKIRWKGHNQNQSIKESIQAQMTRIIKSMGLDPNRGDVMKWHYITHKMAYHIGQRIAISNLILRPFVQQELVSISENRKNPYKDLGRIGPNLMHDLLIVINPELASEKFDMESKNISRDYISSRLKALGGAINFEERPEPVIFGIIEDISNGPADCFLELVKGFRWVEDLPHRIQLAEMIEKCYDLIKGDDLKDLYFPLYKEAIIQLENDKIELSISGSYAAKFLLFQLFD